MNDNSILASCRERANFESCGLGLDTGLDLRPSGEGAGAEVAGIDLSAPVPTTCSAISTARSPVSGYSSSASSD